jgi:hypothetical protein
MMHHLVQTLTSWRAPMKKHHIWCSLNANLQWPLGGNLDPTCIGFFSFISFSNNRTMQDSLVITDALLFDSKFPLVLSIPVIYLKSVTSHQFLKRRAQCRTLPVCLWNVRIWGENFWDMMKLSIWSHHLQASSSFYKLGLWKPNSSDSRATLRHQLPSSRMYDQVSKKYIFHHKSSGKSGRLTLSMPSNVDLSPAINPLDHTKSQLYSNIIQVNTEFCQIAVISILFNI